MTIARRSIFTRDDVRSAAEQVHDNLNRTGNTPAYDAEVRRLQNAHKITGEQHDAMHNQQPSAQGLSPAEAYKLKVANAHKGK